MRTSAGIGDPSNEAAECKPRFPEPGLRSSRWNPGRGPCVCRAPVPESPPLQALLLSGILGTPSRVAPVITAPLGSLGQWNLATGVPGRQRSTAPGPGPAFPGCPVPGSRVPGPGNLSSAPELRTSPVLQGPVPQDSRYPGNCA